MSRRLLNVRLFTFALVIIYTVLCYAYLESAGLMIAVGTTQCILISEGIADMRDRLEGKHRYVYERIYIDHEEAR